MSKVKHLLRRLHIRGGSTTASTPPLISPPPTPSPSPPSSSSSPSARTAAVNSVDFDFFDEEFQVQVAMAMSVSDPDALEDPETAQIKAAKQISLGCSPSEILAEFLSIRYWRNDVVNYDEKVLDGFYDVYGVIPNSIAQGKMPLLVDLQAIPVSDSIDYEVISVNRVVDPELQQLEERVYVISMEHQPFEQDPSVSGLIKKIANIVVHRMGGLVGDVEEMMKKWTARRSELRNSLNSIILPLGCLDVGLSRHRALLFKVLADRINLPCMLLKQSYYTGTGEGVVNLIKLDNGRDYIIDLMCDPGMLIPAEISRSRLQSSQLETEGVKTLCQVLENGSGTVAVSPDFDGVAKADCPKSEAALFMGIRLKGNKGNRVKQNQKEKFELDFGKLLPSLCRSLEGSSGFSGGESASRRIKVKDVSKCVINAAKNPEFAQKLHAVLLESGRLSPSDFILDMNPQDLKECKVVEKIIFTNVEKVDDMALYNAKMLLSSNQHIGLRSPSNVHYDSKEKHFLEDSVGEKMGMTCSVHNTGHSLPSDTTRELIVLVSSGSKRVIQTDNASEGVTTVDLTGMIARSLHREQSDKLSTQSQANSCKVTSKISITNDGVQTVSELPNSSDSFNSRIHSSLGKVAEWEIPWEDIQIGERIGIGSSGEVHRADWNGTEVAVKKFMDQDISGRALSRFNCEVEIMLKLRHPNVVLFMGAVTHPSNRSIMTEFLSRGSLFRLLHRQNTQLGERRRMLMALDVAKGMNYLHTSRPVIVHRDLKTPNLLVDKDWVVKVCDFGSSRMKHETFLSSMSTAGTPEWMAPEALRNEPCNEKSDVYSFGVILWELATLCIPWTGLNSMQVVGAVGFQDRHLDIPSEVDPMVAKILTDCWHRNPQMRPSFRELISRIKHLEILVVPRK